MNENSNSTGFCIVRGDRSGVFFARVKERNGQEAVLTECRRLWYWEGAASLSQLATEGVKRPAQCKFTVTVSEMTVTDVIEVIPCTEQAVKVIQAVPVWKI